MHAALEVQESVRPRPTPRTSSDSASSLLGRSTGTAALWIGALLLIVALSLADSLLANVVPYERDTIVFYFPLMSWVRQQLLQGVLPLWTPQFFGGYPIFADGEIGLAYPPVLLALISMPAERAFVVLRLVHLSIAAIGMFVLARTWRLPYSSAALAAVVLAFGSFLQAQIHHENITRTASWLPLTLAFVELALRADAWPARLRWSALASIVLGLAGLSLHSQMLAIELMVLAGYAAFRWIVGPLGGGPASFRQRLVRVARVCAPVAVLGLGLAAVQLMPLAELAGFSARGGGIPYSESAAYSLTPHGLLQLVFPYVFRGPGNMQWGLWTHWESYLYIGLAPLALAIVALVRVRRGEVVGWGVMALVSVLLALGQYSPIGLHYVLWLLPGLSGLRAPGRFTYVVILAAAMLAGYGLAWLVDGSRSRSSARPVLKGLTVGAAALAVALLALHAAVLTWPGPARDVIQRAYLALPHDSYQLTQSMVVNGLLWSTDLGNPRLAGALLGAVVVLLALWLSQSARCAAWRGWPSLFVGLAAVDLLLFGWAIHPREPLAKISAEPPAVRALEQLPSTDAAPNRILVSPVLNQVAADRLAPIGSLQEASGYSSLQFIWHRDYLGRVLYADDALLDLWNVRYILDPPRYGTLSNNQGVDFLPQQALLQAPAGSALGEQQFVLAGRSPVAQLRFVSALMGASDLAPGTPVAEVELRDASNEVLATAELQAVRDTRPANAPRPQARDLSFAAFEFQRPIGGATSVVVRATPPAGEFALFGGAVIGSNGSAEQLFGKTKTKYRQVYVDDEIRVLEDTAAFPRAFLVPSARVAPSLGTALNLMVHQPFQPDQEVILAADDASIQNAAAPVRGGHGTASVTAYAAGEVRVRVSASGDAWLVLSDTYYPGWTATIDGQPAPVLRGDVLFRVVPVPTGEHDVAFRFDPASVKLGLAISLASVALLAAALLLAGRWGRPGRTT